MIQLLIPESRNTDPVRFSKNKIRVFVVVEEMGISQGYWIEEDILFSLLPYDQKRTYLLEKRGTPLCLPIPSSCAKKVIDSGFSSSAAKSKKSLVGMIDELERNK